MCMMGGFGVFALLLMMIGMLFFLALVAGGIWLLARWLNRQRTPTLLYPPQRQDSYQPYQQGYQPPQQQMPQASQEGEQQDPNLRPQYEQPQVQYPQEQEMPWHR